MRARGQEVEEEKCRQSKSSGEARRQRALNASCIRISSLRAARWKIEFHEGCVNLMLNLADDNHYNFIIVLISRRGGSLVN